tara:strand:+ start:4224 stop:5522 length:1299 start_codon:yes stop_codon:yes gene_type:complete
MKAHVFYQSNIYIAIVYIFFIEGLLAQSKELIKPNKIGLQQNSIPNTIEVSKILFSGFVFQNTEKKQIWYVPNIFDLFPVNTVEGFVINPKVKFTQNYEDGRFYTFMPNIRYGFGNNRLQLQLKTNFFYNPKSKSSLHLSGGKNVEQLYVESTLSAFNNTVYTFSFKENFLKSYERIYVEIKHVFSPINNFLLSTKISWNERIPLDNLPRYQEDDAYTSNNPKNIEVDNTAFLKNKAVLFEANLRWQIGHHYEKKRGQMISKGKYPAITVSYTNALEGVFNSDISYQKVAFEIEDSFKSGKSQGEVHIMIGDFISKDHLTFVDFNHFKGKQTVYGEFSSSQFQVLEYYNYSTANFYFQGHYEHRYRLLTENGKSTFQPTIAINYLYTQAAGDYIELGIGVDKVFNNWHVSFYNSWLEGKYDSFGIRIGVSFD